ncbi:Fe-S cluster assembly protein HesB [Nocardioides massiliensis]|uniref:Fe-S cluster assembly iron-binding protein IscA n=1 Tax=Nocardioides massiliensis TaxID=1325935 RepID=A0ABT9NSG3_9ACTN|nr:Fe-S cluster assembly protein HesB [Nocardioides massiliensis]MDP9823357.1 Fe-S cluster assembly iron-binding protein IscA [Nocardioides massiliensis]
MLTLTPDATAAVKALVDSTEEAPSAGLRITQDAPDSPALNVITTSAPEPGDAVLEEGGARVFLEETAAQTLDDKVLDAAVNDNGAVQFSIGVQA